MKTGVWAVVTMLSMSCALEEGSRTPREPVKSPEAVSSAESSPPAPAPAPTEAPTATNQKGPALALGIVLDRSGSMTGLPMSEAKKGLTAVAQKLSEDDALSVIVFDSEPLQILKLASKKRTPGLFGAIDGIQPGGGTNARPALAKALSDLSAVSALRKHIVLVTDGLFPSEGMTELADTAASRGITISTIGLGASTDRDLLGRLADIGHGRFVEVSDVRQLSATFTREIDQARPQI